MNNDTTQFFTFSHLPQGPLRDTSAKFHDLVIDFMQTLPDSPETEMCFRKLLEAKDCAVRSVLAEIKRQEEKGGV